MATSVIGGRLFHPIRISIRYRSKVNIQRPKPPHFEKALIQEICKPLYPKNPIPKAERCFNIIYKQRKKEINPYEVFLSKKVLEMFEQNKMIAFFHCNPMDSEEAFDIKKYFFRQNMKYTKYNNNIMKMALTGTKYEPVLHLFISHTSLVFSPEVKANKLLSTIKKTPQIVLLATLIEGRLLSKQETVAYSRLPGLDVMRAQLCATLDSVGIQLSQHLTHHQQMLSQNLMQFVKQNTDTANTTVDDAAEAQKQDHTKDK